MEFFNSHGIIPNQNQLDLLRHLLVMTFVIHMPYVGLVIGSTPRT
jgi:hypothetical protein